MLARHVSRWVGSVASILSGGSAVIEYVGLCGPYTNVWFEIVSIIIELAGQLRRFAVMAFGLLRGEW